MKTTKKLKKLKSQILSDISDFTIEIGCTICLRLYNQERKPVRCHNSHSACLSCHMTHISTTNKDFSRATTTKTLCFTCRSPITLILPFNKNQLDDSRLLLSKHAYTLFNRMRRYIKQTQKIIKRVKTISAANLVRQKHRLPIVPVQTHQQYVKCIDLRTPPPSPPTNDNVPSTSNIDDEPPPLAPLSPPPPHPFALFE